MSMKRGDEAEQDFRKAIEIDPHSIQAFKGLAGYFRLQNRMPDALKILEKGIEANPDSAELQILRADVLYTAQKKDQAAAILKQFLDKHPKSADDALAIGDFYTLRGDGDAAAAVYRLGMNADPKNVPLKERMVEWYTDSGKLTEAEALIAEIIRIRPKDPIAGIARGRIRLAQHKPDEAVTILRQQTGDSADIWQAHYFLAVAYRQVQQVGQAKNELQEALRIAPNSVLVRRAMTELSFETGDIQTARETAERTVQLYPASPHDHVLLGTVMLMQRQVPAARHQFGVARQLAPGDAEPSLSLGMAAAAERKWAEAEQQFEGALKLNPRLGTALGALADVWLATGQIQKGIARATQQVAAYPDDAGAHFVLASLYAASGRPGDAKDQFGRAIQLNPQLVQAYTRLADLHQRLGESDSALARYEQALAIEPKSVVLHSIVAELYSRKGNAAVARKHYEQALAADPSFAPAANNLAWLELQNGGNLDVALGWAQKAKELLPDSPATTDTLAWVEYKKGLVSSAIPLLKECVQRAPQSAVYQYHLGIALAGTGTGAEAKAHLEMALRLKLAQPDSEDARRALSTLN
jgi:tetratricopeptide (TPR) repeat protein